MNDFTAKPSSSALIIAENKGYRPPGGCVGIFFKLFDWNRRFGKKKHFPKKLVAPARLNQVSKKFNVDEKLPMPKHQKLIADKKDRVFPAMDAQVKGGGGGGGCSCVSLEQRRDTKSPSLVARLMGLESMPPVEEDCKTTDKVVTHCGRSGLESDKEVGNLEKGGSMRNELQPQKIQKTGVSERRPISRLGGDALLIRNALSRTRKRHPKLVSPVKSPRRSSSRLMDAAARILEPGLQPRNRTQCSLTYSDAFQEERMMIDSPAQSCYNVCSSSPHLHRLKAQSSSCNCGHFNESMNLKKSGGSSSGTQLSMHNEFFHSVEENRPRQGIFSDKKSQVVLLRSQHQPGNPEYFSPDALNSLSFHHERVVSPSLALKHRVRALPKSQPLTLHSGDKSFLRPRRAPIHTKDFIALNCNVSQSSVRFPREPGNPTQVKRQYTIPRNDVLSTQKNLVRRTTATCKQVECTSSSRLTMDYKHRNMKSRAGTGNKGANPTFDKSTSSVAEGGNGVSQSKDIDVVSFTFSSPLKSKSSSFSPTQVDNKGRDASNFPENDGICWPKMVDEDTQGEKSSHSSDVIGALLQQKLKELTHQAEYESRTATLPQGRSTASILQELISALAAEKPILPDTNDNLSSSSALLHTTSQVETRAKMMFSGDRLSPGSVLDASFSNDSYISSSRDDASGHMFQSDDMDVSYEEPRLLHPDADLVDSASSYINRENRYRKIVPVTHLLDHISSLLGRAHVSNTNPYYAGYTNEVLLKAEMLFGNPVGPERFVDFLVGSFLDELETLAAAAWRSTVILGFHMSNCGGGDKQKPLRAFLLDCLVECIDLRYARCSDCGFREWCKLPAQMTTEALLQVFDYEVRRWASLAMMSTDEVIDWEMSTLSGKWADLNLEAFESGTQICQGIFQSLVDEVVQDIW
ncbi:hypothetical protein V2J09_013386 [Rumex salicifolius]